MTNEEDDREVTISLNGAISYMLLRCFGGSQHLYSSISSCLQKFLWRATDCSLPISKSLGFVQLGKT